MYSPDGVTIQYFQEGLALDRLCTDLEEIQKHFASVYKQKDGQPCEVCDIETI